MTSLQVLWKEVFHRHRAVYNVNVSPLALIVA